MTVEPKRNTQKGAKTKKDNFWEKVLIGASLREEINEKRCKVLERKEKVLAIGCSQCGSNFRLALMDNGINCFVCPNSDFVKIAIEQKRLYLYDLEVKVVEE